MAATPIYFPEIYSSLFAGITVCSAHSRFAGLATGFLSVLLVVFCPPLLLHIYLGSYSRFIADDFCSSAVARSRAAFGNTLLVHDLAHGLLGTDGLGHFADAGLPHDDHSCLYSVCLAVCWAYVAGRVFRHLLLRRTRGVMIALSFVALLAFGAVAGESTRRMWKQRSVFAGYIPVWDEREALIQN